MNYPNHNLDAWPIVEMRARLIFLFRAYKIDTILVYDPSGLYERNPDHYIVARAAESAFWMSKSEWDYPEHFKFGLTPHGPNEAYYFARGPQLANRVVDIGEFIDRKVHANMANVTQGPAGNQGAVRRKRLAAQGRKLALLGNNDEEANRAYTKYFALEHDRVRGAWIRICGAVPLDRTGSGRFRGTRPAELVAVVRRAGETSSTRAG